MASLEGLTLADLGLTKKKISEDRHGFVEDSIFQKRPQQHPVLHVPKPQLTLPSF